MDSVNSCDICPQINKIKLDAYWRARADGSPDPIFEAERVKIAIQKLWPDRFSIVDGYHDCDECEETRNQLYEYWARSK